MPISHHSPPNLASNPNHSLPNFASNPNPHHSLPNLASNRSNRNPRQTPTRINTVASSSSSLPTMKITADSLSQLLYLGFSSCSICMEDYSVSQKINQLPCKHIFHRHCIASWLKRSKTCPLCRCKVSALSRPIQQSQDRDSGNFRELLRRGFRWLYSTDPSAHVDHLHFPEYVVYGGANSHRVLNVNVNVNMNVNVNTNVNVNVDPMLDADADSVMLDADGDTVILDADGDTMMLCA